MPLPGKQTAGEAGKLTSALRSAKSSVSMASGARSWKATPGAGSSADTLAMIRAFSCSA